MRNFLRVSAVALALAAGALPLANCTNDQVTKANTTLDTVDQRIANFNAIYDRVSQTINTTSMTTIKPRCQAVMQTGSILKGMVKKYNDVLTVLDASTSALDAFCTSPPSDIDTAVVALAQAAANAQAAINAHGG